MGQEVSTVTEDEDRRDTIIAVSMVAGFAFFCVAGVTLYFCWQAKKARREESLEH
jgi:heme/copper-type cytochrome/quinol oxidase subunit 2